MILIHICPDILTLNTLMQQAFPFLQTEATSNQQQQQQKRRVGKEVPLQWPMSTGCQNDTQLKQTNKTSYVSWNLDGGYEWVNTGAMEVIMENVMIIINHYLEAEVCS